MKRLIAVLALIGIPAIAPAQNLLTNGGFETGDLFGWSLALGSCTSGAVIGDPGHYALAISTGAAPCTFTLSQAFGPFSTTDIAGGGPSFSYYITGGTLQTGFDPAWLMLSAGGTWGGCESYDMGGYVIQPCSGYVSTTLPLRLTLTATLPEASIFRLDDVAFSASVIKGGISTPVLLATTTTPEPATLALLASGLIGIGIVRGRRVTRAAGSA